MNIPYLVRTEGTQFYPTVAAGLREAGPAALRDGQSIICNLPKAGGYSGDVSVTIRPEAEFEADWEGKDGDWSRFPARIRAAATALRDAGFQGNARISHEDGRLTIRLDG